MPRAALAAVALALPIAAAAPVAAQTPPPPAAGQTPPRAATAPESTPDSAPGPAAVPDAIPCPPVTLLAPYDEAAIRAVFPAEPREMPLPGNWRSDPRTLGRLQATLGDTFLSAMPDRLASFRIAYGPSAATLLILGLREGRVVAVHCGLSITP